jgi:hypothetical protein
MSFETIHFENAGVKTLSGRLDRPLEGAPLAYAIFAHCFTCSKQMRALLVLHAPVNDTVGIDNAAQIHRAARNPRASSGWTPPISCSATRQTPTMLAV